MNIEQHSPTTKPVRYSLKDILENPGDPAPEIELTPVSAARRLKMADDCTTLQAVPNPDKPGTYLYPSVFNERAYNKVLVYEALTGLEHLERADGTALMPKDADLDFLFEILGMQFFVWVLQQVKALNERADTAGPLKKEAARKNS